MSSMTVLLRRELWEHRVITAAPAVFTALFVVVALLAAAGAIHVQVSDANVDIASLLRDIDGREMSALLQVGLVLLAGVFNTVMMLVIAYYLLDCLYAERKDRSILFWKSLPVSDLEVVGSKLLTASVVIPLVTVAAFLAAALGVYLIGGVTVLLSGSGAVLAAGPGAILETTLTMLYAFVVQSLWYLPLLCWLLLVSAWARRAVLLWVVLPPLAVGVIESLLFHTDHFARMLAQRLVGVFPLAFSERGASDVAIQYQGDHGEMDLTITDGVSQLIDPGTLLSSASLWMGLVVAAVFFAGAVLARRFRDET
jgi:ABC-2 type transport system permease protein